MLKKMVDGVELDLTAEEEDARHAEEAEWGARRDPLATGLAIVSTAAPALSGSYAIDEDAQRKISGIAAGIAARKRVPGGGATFDYPDIEGSPHAFTPEQFLDFASAVEDFVYALSRGDGPTQPVKIP